MREGDFPPESGPILDKLSGTPLKSNASCCRDPNQRFAQVYMRYGRSSNARSKAVLSIDSVTLIVEIVHKHNSCAGLEQTQCCSASSPLIFLCVSVCETGGGCFFEVCLSCCAVLLLLSGGSFHSRSLVCVARTSRCLQHTWTSRITPNNDRPSENSTTLYN
ncbi:hypothetical protein QQF64_012773 [Cirrhinus molitorella]|uniref:FLYWCH-type domain-containing protein n=1 Tax=Cirrhinus molitorella TaxID=172907 RepID=A0ABR3LWF6_9TELE